MPKLKKASRPINHPAGSLNASATLRRQARPQGFQPGEIEAQLLAAAFFRAALEFRSEHGRLPDWERVIFTGGFTTLEVVVEVVEHPEEE